MLPTDGVDAGTNAGTGDPLREQFGNAGGEINCSLDASSEGGRAGALLCRGSQSMIGCVSATQRRIFDG